MNSGIERDAIILALRALFLMGLPVVVGVALVGTVAAIFQASTATYDSALSYAARLLALVLVLYLFTPGSLQLITSLFEMAVR